jgi:hypothetical protein
MIKKSIGSDKNVKGFRYNTPTSTILETMKVNPLVPVFMFSAGCSKANEIANGPMANKLKIFIIEPYNLSAGTRANVQAAVSNGVPAKNVFVGPDAARGKGIVSGESSSQSPTHWGALEKIGNLVKI